MLGGTRHVNSVIGFFEIICAKVPTGAQHFCPTRRLVARRPKSRRRHAQVATIPIEASHRAISSAVCRSSAGEGICPVSFDERLVETATPASKRAFSRRKRFSEERRERAARPIVKPAAP